MTVSKLAAVVAIALAASALAFVVADDDEDNRGAETRPFETHVPTTAMYRFVAVTSATTPADVGWKGMADLCRAEFAAEHPEARMCFTEETLRTNPSKWPEFTGQAWVQPVVVAAAGSTQFWDVTTLSYNGGNRNCDMWSLTLPTRRGMTVQSNGTFPTPICDTSHSVACCAPAP